MELGARMVPFAGYSMPVQYRLGVMAEHLHTRQSAGLFDVSHMGQLKLVGPDAAAAFESLMPVDVIDLPVGKQRYGLLLTDEGTVIDDLMFVNRGSDLFVIVNGACKVGDIAHLQQKIGMRCDVIPMPERALLALQGPLAVQALQRLVPGVNRLVFMTGDSFSWHGGDLFITRSGYTGEDGFEVSVQGEHADALARALLAHAAKVEGQGFDEDQLAFLRDERAYFNLTLVELPMRRSSAHAPGGDFADTVLRNFLLASWLKASEKRRA